jgi:hypothetical protein
MLRVLGLVGHLVAGDHWQETFWIDLNVMLQKYTLPVSRKLEVVQVSFDFWDEEKSLMWCVLAVFVVYFIENFTLVLWHKGKCN